MNVFIPPGWRPRAPESLSWFSGLLSHTITPVGHAASPDLSCSLGEQHYYYCRNIETVAKTMEPSCNKPELKYISMTVDKCLSPSPPPALTGCRLKYKLTGHSNKHAPETMLPPAVLQYIIYNWCIQSSGTNQHWSLFLKSHSKCWLWLICLDLSSTHFWNFMQHWSQLSAGKICRYLIRHVSTTCF